MAAKRKKAKTAAAAAAPTGGRGSKKTGTRKKTSTKAAAAPAPSNNEEVLLVGSKVRQLIKDADCNTGGDAVEGLNQWVHFLIKQATARAQANGRKTVRKHDFMIA